MRSDARFPVGVVLAGGLSSRLGRDKCGLCFGDPPVDLLTRTARLLQGLVPRVIVSGRTHGAFESLPDDESGVGPLGGVITALRHTGASCLVLAGDMPFMDEATLAILLEAWRQRPEGALLTTFVHEESGSRETLVSVYEPRALPLLESRLEQRMLKLADAVPPEARHLVSYATHAALPFFSINYPADMQAARLLGTQRFPI